jgi:hypothetical protein
MPQQTIIVDEKGVRSVEIRVNSVSDAVSASQLASKIALATRLLHQAAKAVDLPPGPVEPISYQDAVLGTFTFFCVCGRRFTGPWEESRYESIRHIELCHTDKDTRRDLDALEDVIEALIVPNPLYSWDELQENAQ